MINEQLFFAPHPALCGVVNNIMIGHTVTPDLNTRLSFHFPPLPEHSILFYPHDKPLVEDINTKQTRSLFSCTITGPQSRRTVLSLGRNHLMIKIGFQPGVLHRLLRCSMQAMVQQDYDGELIFGSSIRHLVDAMANAPDFLAMKNLADGFMMAQLIKIKNPVSIDYIIPEIIKHGGMQKIDVLVDKACLSNRQFERAFKDRMGVSPKFYSRLVRFGNAWLLKENNPAMTWTEVAHQCHYFDQMHMIRDFKTFADVNPKLISDAFERQPFPLVKRIFN